METPTYGDGRTFRGGDGPRPEAAPQNNPNTQNSGQNVILLQGVSARRSGVKNAQRLLDLILCGVLLLLIWPVFGVIALLIRLDSPGPVLFKQKRVGQNGQEFWFYKFRSMVTDAEAKRHLLEMHNERSGPVFKMKNDPRVTRVGRVLRKFSLDELPPASQRHQGRDEPGRSASRPAQ